jgi:hypothetical protein
MRLMKYGIDAMLPQLKSLMHPSDGFRAQSNITKFQSSPVVRAINIKKELKKSWKFLFSSIILDLIIPLKKKLPRIENMK